MVPLHGVELPAIERLRSYERTTDLTRGGVIVAPAGADYQAAATQLRDHLRATLQAEYRLANRLEAAPAPGQVVIALGNMMVNPVVESLYWNLYTSVDPRFPGANGFVIQTVAQPLPLLPRNHVLVLAGSNAATTAQAVKTLCTRVTDKTMALLGPTLEVAGKPEEKIGRAGKGLRGLRGAADRFRLSGDRRYVAQALEVLDAHASAAEANPNWVLVWGDEIDSWRAMQAWDFLQEFADLAPEQALRYERLMLRLIDKLVPRAEIFGNIKQESVLGWNHTSIPLLGIHAIARYYTQHYQLPLAPYLEQPRWYFEGQKVNSRVSCDNFNYGEFSLQFILAYYSMQDDWAYFNNGNARKFIDLLLAQLDNNGLAGGTGDAHDIETPGARFGWDIIDAKLPLPELLWFKERWQAKQGGNQDQLRHDQRGKESEENLGSRYRPELRAQRPDWLAGCVSIPVDPALYRHLEAKGPFRMVDLAGLPKMAPTCPLEKAFDKLQFRSFAPAGGEYWLVDGFGQGNHGHMDTASLVCCTLDGYRFLYDAEYLDARSSEHSMLTILKDGEASAPPPPLASLEARCNFGNGAYARVAVHGYNGATWNRRLLWLPNKYMLALDSVTAEQAGSFRIDCAWKVVNRGMEEFDGRNLVCRAPNPKIDKLSGFPAKTFFLRSVDAGEWAPRLSESGFATHLITQRKTVALAAGQTVSFSTVMGSGAPGEKTAPAYTLRRITETAVLMEGVGSPVLVAAGAGLAGLSTDADVVAACTQELFAADVTSIQLGGKKLLSASSRISLRLADGRLEISAEQAGRLELACTHGVESIAYGAGKSQPEIKAEWQLAGVADFIAALKPMPAAVTDTREIAEWRADWSLRGDQKGNPDQDIAMGDIDGDGRSEALIASGKALVCLDAAGRERWRYTHAEPVLSCCLPARPNGEYVALAGTKDSLVLAFDAAGKCVRQVKIERHQSGTFGFRDNHWVTPLKSADANGDGVPEVIVGLRSWQTAVLTEHLEPYWYNAQIWHGVASVYVVANRAGSPRLYFGDKYGGAYAFTVPKDNRDELMRASFNGIGDVTIAVTDLNGDGVDEMIAASQQGRVTAYDLTQKVHDDLYPTDDPEARPLWRYNSYGYGFTDIVLAEVAGKSVAALGSEAGYVYFLHVKTGQPASVVAMPEGIVKLLVLADGRLVAGGNRGGVYLFDGAGRMLKTGRLPARIVRLAAAGGQVLAIDEQGNVSQFTP